MLTVPTACSGADLCFCTPLLNPPPPHGRARQSPTGGTSFRSVRVLASLCPVRRSPEQCSAQRHTSDSASDSSLNGKARLRVCAGTVQRGSLLTGRRTQGADGGRRGERSLKGWVSVRRRNCTGHLYPFPSEGAGHQISANWKGAGRPMGRYQPIREKWAVFWDLSL